MSKTATKAPKDGGVRGYVQSLLMAVLLALVFRQFVLQAFRIPSESMQRTLLVGDFLFVNKFLYGSPVPFTDWRLPKIRTPHRGDIIVFKSPSTGQDFIKRCVAVAGDTVEVREKDLYLNGVRQNEPYIQHIAPDVRRRGSGDPRDWFGPYVVPPGNLFMMGDNRDNSADSRYWGPLPLNNIKGKAMFIYFSIDTTRGFIPPHLRLRRIGRLIH
jgi:signal peptidase I